MEGGVMKRLHTILAGSTDVCMITGSYDVERHHVFHATHRQRMLCEKYGFIAPLRRDLHQNGPDSVHRHPNGPFDRTLKQMCQFYYEEHIGSRETFIREFGKNYL